MRSRTAASGRAGARGRAARARRLERSPSSAARSRHSARSRSGVDAVVLGAPRRQRRHLRGRRARRPAPLELRLDLRPAAAERAQHRSRGTPAMSAIPLRTGVHSTPSSRVSSPAARLVQIAGRLARARKTGGRRAPTSARPAPCTRLATSTCVCSCGSPARDVRWRNAAAMRPSARRHCAPPWPRRATAARALEVAQRLPTAGSCAPTDRAAHRRRRARTARSRSSAPRTSGRNRRRSAGTAEHAAARRLPYSSSTRRSSRPRPSPSARAHARPPRATRPRLGGVEVVVLGPVAAADNIHPIPRLIEVVAACPPRACRWRS